MIKIIFAVVIIAFIVAIIYEITHSPHDGNF